MFLNIYHFWCFLKYLSPYYTWGNKALKCLERNIKRKWSKDFTNVNLFIELVKRQLKEVDTSFHFFNSENYFTKLMFSKPIMDLMVREQHLPKNNKKIIKKVDCKIRKCIR